MPLDDELMRNQTEKTDNSASNSADRAGALRQAQRGEKNTDNPENANNDLRSSRMTAMRARASKLKNKLAVVQKSVSVDASKLLQAAWRNIIMSFGFSFLYVYVHLFLQQIFGKKLFAPLGSEWRDRPGLTIEERERMGAPFKLMESFGVGCLTIVLFIVVIFFLSVSALITEVTTNPIRNALKLLLEGFKSFLTDK
ncbi:hypothetical protein JXE04_01990 [Patescibacteria group bacterium]|nr:hypothetical protein [Patescibacteria group bacterium]